jgi:hypothetical protein
MLLPQRLGGLCHALQGILAMTGRSGILDEALQIISVIPSELADAQNRLLAVDIRANKYCEHI